MNNEFLMKVVTIQNIEGEREIIEMTTNAVLDGENEDYSLSYYDSEGDMKDCKTTLHVKDGNCVTIRREGDYNKYCSSHVMNGRQRDSNVSQRLICLLVYCFTLRRTGGGLARHLDHFFRVSVCVFNQSH